ncbi:tripartite motif-containing protein 16 [Archocentrus centrarchus]|uniref:tripartite motif-containing protein 16 n=1 Tax=Archocentrus centrarchus TaxID=63155 RepID=UPI0011E9F075|nr:tripartite motif-containing protein 16 [Archocentrus centrarchus]
MAETAAVEAAALSTHQQQQLCGVCSGKLSGEKPAVCGHSVCESCKTEDCPQCPARPGSPKQNGTAEAPVTKSNEKQSQDSKTAEESKIQEDLKESEDPTKPEEEKKDAEPQTDQGSKEEAEPLGPDDVVCDSCIESPRRAHKSCLTCLVSYCEAHLRPHLENPKFQNHRLVDPLRDIERRTCESHKWPLDVFCRADACCICQDCLKEDHKGHNTVPAVEARNQIEKELREKQTEVVKMVTAAENAVNKLQLNTVSIEQSVKDVRDMIESQFEELQAVVEKAKKEVTEILEGEEKQALQQAEGIRVHLEQKCTDLKKTQVLMEKISKNKNDVDFLQEYATWKKEATDISLPGIYIGLMDCLDSFSCVIVDSTKKLCAMVESSYIKKVKDTCGNNRVGIKNTVKAIIAAKHISAPDPVVRADFLKYTAQVTFDPITAHKFLRLTEDNRKVTNTTPWQHPYPDVPERFEKWRQVLAVESFYMGRHYFEVDIDGDGIHVGLTYKSIPRKGNESNSCITGNCFSWCLQCNGRTFSAWHCDVETQLNLEKFNRIGVYLDYTRGLLAFYGVEDSMTLIHKYKTEFHEPLYPVVWLPKKESIVLLVAPGEPLTPKRPSPPLSPIHGAGAS